MYTYKIKKEMIQKWIKNYILEFGKMDRLGHLLENHVNIKEERLKFRCKRERVDVSTFIGNSSDIISNIVEIMLDSYDEIAGYLADDSDTQRWVLEGYLNDNVKGIAFKYRGHNWNDGALSCKKMCIVIQKKKGENGFYVKTVYPLPPD